MLKQGGIFPLWLARLVLTFSCVEWEGESIPPVPQSSVSNGAGIPAEALLAV